MRNFEPNRRRGDAAVIALVIAAIALFASPSQSAPPGGAHGNSKPAAASSSAKFVVALPRIPLRTFKVTDFGTVGDGRTKDTAALQRAIDECAKAGGGTVIVPEGKYLTGPLHLASNMELRLEKGATLVLSDDPTDFKLTKNRYENGFTAANGHDIAITGTGTIDGQGEGWWLKFHQDDKSAPHRPYLVAFTGCRRVLVQDVTLVNSPMFHLVPQRCQDVTIDSVHILAPESAPNTDGIDPSGWRFHILNCVIDTGDDNIAIKPDGRIEPGQPACKDFLIESCAFLRGHGMSVGGQTPGGLSNLTVRNCTFRNTNAGIRLKASRGQGGLVENLTYENLTMINVRTAIDISSFYNPSATMGTRPDPASDGAQPVDGTTPIWRHIVIRNVTATDCAVDGQIFGLAEMPIADIALVNVQLTGHAGMSIINARGVRFRGSHVSADVGEPVTVASATVTGL